MSNSTPSQKPTGSENPLFVWVGTAILGIVLISAGIIPPSCARFFPIINRQAKDLCDACGGDGKREHSCRVCHGHGYWAGAKCAACGSTGKVEETCPYCLGSGKKPTK
jgi:predicted amidophosphoribosyltransferase